MDLSKIAIEPRLRNGWEAIDLGFVMAKRWFLPLWLAWVVPSAIVMVTLLAILPGYPWVGFLVMWWLKPLWDRLPLIYASRALFGEYISLRELYKNCLRSFKTNWFASLTWRRLSPTRSFDLPLTVLEGLTGEARSRRMSGLHQTSGNAAIWLTFSGFFIEQILSTGVWGLLLMLAPQEYQKSLWEVAFSEQVLLSHVSLLLTFLLMSLVAPFYVISGFALYICRRVELEAWDIEVRFRHLVTRAEKKTNKSGLNLSALMGFMLMGCVVVVSCFAPTESWAQEALQETEEPEFIGNYYQLLRADANASNAKNEIIEILGSEDFHNYELEKKWRFKQTAEEKPEDVDREGFYQFLDWLEGIFGFLKPLRKLLTGFAQMFEVAIWVLGIGLIAYLIYRYRKGMLSLFGRKTFEETIHHEPTTLFGLDVRRESLPDDVPADVMKLWEAKQFREAVGLLYRATLSRLIYDFSFQFFDGYTEQECIDVLEISLTSSDSGQVSAITKSQHKTLIDFLRRLTRVWQAIAYAHNLPQGETVAALCNEWSNLFDRAAKS